MGPLGTGPFAIAGRNKKQIRITYSFKNNKYSNYIVTKTYKEEIELKKIHRLSTSYLKKQKN